MRLVLLGAPGAGKGTQAVILSEKLKVPHISTGDIFRYNIKNGTPLGIMAKEYIDKGALVPDEVTIGIVKDRLAQPDCSEGYILDGFPRTIPQAESLDAVLSEMDVSLDYAVDIFVPDSEIIKRLTGRRVCSACSMSYHILFNPPRYEGQCNECGTSLIQREDDSKETILKRLENYHKQTEPLLEYYKSKGMLLVVEGNGNIGDTSSEILKILGMK